MQVADKVVSVVKWQRHEGTTHQDKLHLHGTVHIKPCLLMIYMQEQQSHAGLGLHVAVAVLSIVCICSL